MSVPMTTVYADPYQVTNPGREAQSLAGALGLPVATLQAEPERSQRLCLLGPHDPDATAAKVQKLLDAGSLPGMYTMQEPKRFYPAGQLASPMLGIVGIDGQGLSGLEYKYNAPAGRQTRQAGGGHGPGRRPDPGRVAGIPGAGAGRRPCAFHQRAFAVRRPRRPWPGLSWPLRPKAGWP